MPLHHFVITIDGPTASGKGAIAGYIAHVYGGLALDVGLLYRYVGVSCHHAGIDPHDADRATAHTQALLATLPLAKLSDPDLRRPENGVYASVYGAITGVRLAMTDAQRQFAEHPPLTRAGYPPSVVVLDGHTCGREVFPDAHLMFYITADTTERAHRRERELAALGFETSHEQVLNDLVANDYRDVMRAIPLGQGDQEVIVVDTTGRDVDQVAAEISDYIHDILGIFPTQPDRDITKHDPERE